jgi:adenylate kinase
MCRALVARRGDLLYFTASDLIAQETGQSFDELREASSDRILRNQVALRRALQRDGGASNTVILDGQCVIDNGRELVILPAADIRALQPKALILLETTANEIFDRRQKDRKQRPHRTVAELEEQLALNHSVVSAYASDLHLPFRIVEARDLSAFEQAIDELRQF